MKKIISLALLIIIASALSSCGYGNDDAENVPFGCECVEINNYGAYKLISIYEATDESYYVHLVHEHLSYVGIVHREDIIFVDHKESDTCDMIGNYTGDPLTKDQIISILKDEGTYVLNGWIVMEDHNIAEKLVSKNQTIIEGVREGFQTTGND